MSEWERETRQREIDFDSSEIPTPNKTFLFQSTSICWYFGVLPILANQLKSC